MKKASAVLVVLWLSFIACGLVACGQKGPLYLPQSGQPAPNAPKHVLLKKQASSANVSVSSEKSSSSAGSSLAH